MPKMLQDNCGVAAFCLNCNAMPKLCDSLSCLQHRGQDSVGFAVKQKDGGISHDLALGLVKQNRELFQKAKGSSAIGHVSLNEPQPYFAHTQIGPICLAFSGNIFNAEAIKQRFKQRGQPFTSKNQAEVLARLICQSSDPIEGLKIMAEQAKGSYALALLTEAGIYIMRDPFGFKPLIIGQTTDGIAVVSESPAITEIGGNIVRNVSPGEIIFLEKQNAYSVGQVHGQRKAHCAIELTYFARRDSVIDGIAVDQVRFALGEKLAEGDSVEADLVAPIPMSGIGYAEGFHAISGITYRSAIIYNQFAGRSNLRLLRADRDNTATEKHSPIPGAIRGKRIVLVEDCIVQGLQISRLIKRLRAAGAKEIHIRVGVPRLIAPCRYGTSTRTGEELIGSRHSEEEIRRIIGADTLKFNCLDNLVAAIGLPEEQLCLGCFTGKFPQ